VVPEAQQERPPQSVLRVHALKRMGIDRNANANVGTFSQGQRQYLEFHRENVLRMARGLSKGESKR
jgi:hypothetical protein